MRCECFRAAINCFRWKCCAEFGVRSWDISPDIYFVSKVVRNGEYKVDRRQIFWRVKLCARVISTKLSFVKGMTEFLEGEVSVICRKIILIHGHGPGVCYLEVKCFK